MDKQEARQLLGEKLEATRRRSYEELGQLLEAGPETGELTGPSGAWYQWEVDAFWDDREGGDIRVVVAIDDGGWRAYIPMAENFIKAPDGSFVDE